MMTPKETPIGNVLILAEYGAPKSGNFIASMLDLADALEKVGSETVFLFPDTSSEHAWVRWIRQNGREVYFLPRNASRDEQLNVLKKIIDEHRIRIAHVHFALAERLMLEQHRSLGVELVIHEHFDFVTNRSQLRQRLSVLKKVRDYRRSGAFCISVMEKKDRWFRLMGKNRHAFISNGLSLRRGEQDPLSPAERRAEIGLQQGEKLVLFLGWDMYRKGLDIAVKAVELYRQREPSLKIGVIGVGSEGKPTAEAERFLGERGIDPFSEAILYMHSYEDIFALNRAVDCYISSSRAEAFSYGILEAISQNTPVVVSDITGTSWCWKYTNCYTYPVNDPAACAEALEKALAAGRADSNYRSIVHDYSNEIWTKRVLDVYRRITQAEGK